MNRLHVIALSVAVSIIGSEGAGVAAVIVMPDLQERGSALSQVEILKDAAKAFLFEFSTAQAMDDEKTEVLAGDKTSDMSTAGRCAAAIEAGQQAQIRGDRATAEKYFRTALALAETFDPEGQAFFASLSNLNGVLYEQGKYKDAEAQIRRGLAIAEKNPQVPRTDLANLLQWLGGTCRAQHKLKECEEAWKRAHECLVKLQGIDAPSTISLRSELIRVYVQDGKNAEAKAIARGAQIKELNDALAWREYTNAGLAAFRVHQYDAAEKSFLGALKLAEAVRADRDDRLAISCMNMGSLRLRQGKAAESARYLEKSLPLIERFYGENSESTVHALELLATSYVHLRDSERATLLIKRLVILRERVYGPNDPDVRYAKQGFVVLGGSLVHINDTGVSGTKKDALEKRATGKQGKAQK